MTKRTRTPSEIAKLREKKTYSFSLKKDQTDELKEMADAAGIPDSELVDAAIETYLESLREQSEKDKNRKD